MNAVRLATTQNITDLTAPPRIIDGVTVLSADRVLVKDQKTRSQNGIYVLSGGSLVRSSDAFDAEDVIRVSEGTTNAHTQWALVSSGPIAVGTTALTFSRQSMPPGWFNIADYGAQGDGSFDNTAIVQTLINTAATVPGQGIVVYVPQGNFYFSDDLFVTRSCALRGVAGALGQHVSYAASQLTFAAGKGLVCPSSSTPPVLGAYADFAIISDLFLRGATLTWTPWSAREPRELGSRTVHPNANRYYFECIARGETGPAMPNFRNAYRPDYTVTRPAGAVVQLGTTVRDTKASTAVYWMCTTAGTTNPAGGAAPPGGWKTAVDSDTVDGTVTWKARSAAGFWITDGSVVWRCRVAPGVNVRAHGVQIRDCQISGFTNAGVHVQSLDLGPGAQPGEANCNSCSMYNCRIRFCGVGIVTRGTDASAGTFTHLQIDSIGLAPWTGTGGVGVWDGGFTGNTWTGVLVETTSGQGYITGIHDGVPEYPNVPTELQNPHGGVFVGCYQESNTLQSIGKHGYVFGGNWGAGGWDLSLGMRCYGAYPVDGANIVVKDVTGPAGAFAQLDSQGSDVLYALGTAGRSPSTDLASPTDHVGMQYNAPSLRRAGWWTQVYGQAYPGSSFSTRNASEGRGWNWQPLGMFKGGNRSSFAGQYFAGFDRKTMREPRLRKLGRYEVGDRFELQDDGSPGGWTGYIVKTAGWRGVTWTANTAISAVDQVSIIEPTPDQPGIPTPGRKVFKATAGGTTAASPMNEPDWASAVSPGDTVAEASPSTVVWTLLGKVPEYSRLGFVDDPVTAMRPQTRHTWADTTDTDASTAAPNAAVRSVRKHASTTTTTPNQVLTTVPLEAQGAYVLDVTIIGGGGSAAAAVSCKLSGSFVRDGSTVTRLGTDTTSVKGNGPIGTSTFDLGVSGTAIQVRTTPGSTGNPIGWTVVTELTEAGGLDFRP